MQQDVSLRMLKPHAADRKEEGGHGKVADAEGPFLPRPFFFDGNEDLRVSGYSLRLPPRRVLVQCTRGPVLHTQATRKAHVRVQPFESSQPRSWPRGWRIGLRQALHKERHAESSGHQHTNLAAPRKPLPQRYSILESYPRKYRHGTVLSAASTVPSPTQGQAQLSA